MDKTVLDRSKYYDKVFACWMGKNIGGTLGGPWEGIKYTHAFDFYEPVPETALPNDDLDLQLVWLKMLEDKGPDPSVRTFAEYWSRYLFRYPWNEYGFFMRNFDRGLRPPVAGCFENYYVDEMGSPIRSEIWACVHPGDPQSAARMAWKDSALDHAGGEGVYGEMFWSAVEAAAFVESDPMTLIQIGLNMIPLSSHLGRSIREAVKCYQDGRTWGEAREKIATQFGHLQPCNAVPNHGFIIIGWLYGEDFGDRLCKAVNCGYDTDCTGATLGSLLGIIGGTPGIPQKWIEPIGDKIVLHKFTCDFHAPTSIKEATDRITLLAENIAAKKEGISFGKGDSLPGNLHTRLFDNTLAQDALDQDNHAGIELAGDTEIWLHYGGEPVIRPGIGKKISVSVKPDSSQDINLIVPDGWNCKRSGPASFELSAGAKSIRGRNTVAVEVDGKSIDFVVLGPSEAKGFEAGKNVESCKLCGARFKTCECPAAE